MSIANKDIQIFVFRHHPSSVCVCVVRFCVVMGGLMNKLLFF